MPKLRNKIRDTYDDDDAEVKDGEVVHVSTFMMDSMQRSIFARRDVADACYGHRPGFAKPADAALERRRIEARDAWVERAANAWKTMGRDQQKPDDPPDDDDDDTNDRQRARSRYLDELTNAWRTRPRMVIGFGPAAVGPGPSVVGAGPTRPVRSSRDAEAVRDAAWREYCTRISSAWRCGS